MRVAPCLIAEKALAWHNSGCSSSPVKTMHVIETQAVITSEGVLEVHAPAPAQIPPGECRVLVVIEESNRTGEPVETWNLPVLPMTSWPENLSLHREDIYGDGGR
jgi:hypothetical protein